MNLFDSTEDVVSVAAAMDVDELRSALIDASASIAASQARMAIAMAVFDERGGSAEGSGFSSFGQWASVDLGLSSRGASILAASGAAMADLPAVREAWLSGALSTNKVATIVSVASAESETKWCTMALEASATQLSRIASAYRRGAEPADDEPSGAERDHRCGVTWRTREDGLIELLAILEPEDAAVVRAALESTIESTWRSGAKPASTDDPAPPSPAAPRPTSARMGDALVELAQTGLEVGPIPIVRGEHTEVVLHIDAALLAGAANEGRCQLTNLDGIDVPGAKRLACDARLRAMVHGADGSAVDLGRTQRLVSDKQRRLITERDHGCTFPGCRNRRYVDAHHVHHWADGGPTNLANLASLCNRHHRLCHRDDFSITANGDGTFTFTNKWGRIIAPPDRVEPASPTRPARESTRARSGGDPNYSVNLAVTALAC